MRKLIWLVAAPGLLAGCSAYDRTVDYLTGSDDKAEVAGKAASEAVAEAAQSDDAASSLLGSATEAASTALADSAAAAIDNNVEKSSMRKRLLKEVRRENDIIVQTKFTAGVSGV